MYNTLIDDKIGLLLHLYLYGFVLKNRNIFTIHDSDGLLAGLQIEYHANVRLQLRRSNSVFLQIHFKTTFSMQNRKLFQFEIVAEKNNYVNHNLPGGVRI